MQREVLQITHHCNKQKDCSSFSLLGEKKSCSFLNPTSTRLLQTIHCGPSALSSVGVPRSIWPVRARQLFVALPTPTH